MGTKVTVTDPENNNKAPWWWRRRIGLTPFYLGASSAAAGYASFLLTVGQALLVLAAVCVCAGFAAHSNWSRKKDRAMRNFVWAVIAAFGAFVTVVRTGALEPGWIFVSLVIGVLGLGAFWWKDNYNVHRIKVERDMERWPIMAKKLSMPQVKRGPVKTTETGRRWMFWWDAGDYTLGAFKGQARGLESALGIPENRIRFEHVFEGKGLKNPNAIIVTENTESPIQKGSVTFDHPTMKYFTDEMFIGYREDNSKHLVTWFHKKFGGMHTLAAGSTGSGKSGLYNLVLAESAYCPDLVRWGIDAKGGMALRPWASLFDWMVDDIDDGSAYWMLTALHKVLLARSKYAADMGWNCWKPDAEHPVLLLVVDEAAEVFGLEAFDMNALSGSIARMGRAAGVLMLIATQHPTNDAIGSTQLTKNLRRRFCFSVEDDHAQRIVIPKSSGRFDATEIPVGPDFAGTYFSSEGGQICDLSGRVRYVTEEDVYRLVMTIGHDPKLGVPGLDKLSEEAARKGSIDPDSGESWYQKRRIYTVRDVIKPEGWVDQGNEPWLAFRPAPVHGEPAAPVHAPRPAPAPEPDDDELDLAAMRLPDEPDDPFAKPVVHEVPEPADVDLDDDPPPWKEGDPTMQLTDLVAPRSEEEAKEQERLVAEYAAQYAQGNVSAEQAQSMLDSMLDAAGPEGVAIADMQKVLKRSPSWYSDNLRTRLFSTPPSVEKVGSRYRRPRPGLRPVDASRDGA